MDIRELKHVSDLVLSYINSLVADIPDEKFHQGQVEGINSPGWCIGHIAVETDDALKWLGGDGVVPEGWYGHYFFTAPPIQAASGLPEKKVLVQSMNQVMTNLWKKLGELDEGVLEKECHSEFLREALPREFDWFAHILTTHVATHAGNIAIWRRFRGYGPVHY